MEYCDIGEFENERRKDFENVFLLRDSYELLVRESGFQDIKFNSVSFQKYKEGSIGITPHRDGLKYINLISVFVLGGEAPFYICKDREGTDKTYLGSSPGSLILLRAPRKPEEKDFRPLHSVGRVGKERYTIGLRQSGQKT